MECGRGVGRDVVVASNNILMETKRVCPMSRRTQMDCYN